MLLSSRGGYWDLAGGMVGDHCPDDVHASSGGTYQELARMMTAVHFERHEQMVTSPPDRLVTEWCVSLRFYVWLRGSLTRYLSRSSTCGGAVC